MIEFTQNDNKKKFILVAALALVLIAAAVYAVCKSVAPPPGTALPTVHYTCASCGNRWIDSSPDPKCPKCGQSGYCTCWAKCPKCQKYMKFVEIEVLPNKEFEWRVPGKDWSKVPAGATVCPNCGAELPNNWHRNPMQTEGWDPPQ
jgi:hypothetical protein